MFTEDGIESIKYFQEHYDIVQRIELGEEKIYLGERRNRTCRFCGLSEPDVSFKKVAHAIPEFLGNRRLFSNYECDNCNDKFSMSVEHHMANYIAPWRTLMTVRGKKGIPTLKNEHDGWRIEGTDGELRVTHRADVPIVKRDTANKMVTFTGHRGQYIPRAVFKCLVKMAISIMPDEELLNFTQTIEWVNKVNYENDGININELLAVFGFIPGPYKSPIINLIFRRKPDSEALVPYMQYVIMFHNLMFQVPIPLCEQDKVMSGKSITIEKYPLPVSDEYGFPKYDILDLTSSVLVKGDSIDISFKYNEVVEQDPN